MFKVSKKRVSRHQRVSDLSKSEVMEWSSKKISVVRGYKWAI